MYRSFCLTMKRSPLVPGLSRTATTLSGRRSSALTWVSTPSPTRVWSSRCGTTTRSKTTPWVRSSSRFGKWTSPQVWRSSRPSGLSPNQRRDPLPPRLQDPSQPTYGPAPVCQTLNRMRWDVIQRWNKHVIVCRIRERIQLTLGDWSIAWAMIHQQTRSFWRSSRQRWAGINIHSVMTFIFPRTWRSLTWWASQTPMSWSVSPTPISSRRSPRWSRAAPTRSGTSPMDMMYTEEWFINGVVDVIPRWEMCLGWLSFFRCLTRTQCLKMIPWER